MLCSRLAGRRGLRPGICVQLDLTSGNKKVFRTLAELLGHLSLDEVLAFYSKNYHKDSLWNVTKSLGYFEDGEGQPDPRDLRGRDWDWIKQFI